MGELVDIDHIRRGQRVLRLLVAQIGIDLFLIDTDLIPRIDDEAIEETLHIASVWLERRSHRQVSPSTMELLCSMLRRHVLIYVARVARTRGL